MNTNRNSDAESNNRLFTTEEDGSVATENEINLFGKRRVEDEETIISDDDEDDKSRVIMNEHKMNFENFNFSPPETVRSVNQEDGLDHNMNKSNSPSRSKCKNL